MTQPPAMTAETPGMDPDDRPTDSDRLLGHALFLAALAALVHQQPEPYLADDLVERLLRERHAFARA